MALDFHVAESEKEAPMKYGGASFDEAIHETIFVKAGLSEGRFRFFRRMEDYYVDAEYVGDDVKELLAEINELEGIFVSDNAVLNQLGRIKRMCHKAIDNHMSIWVYCD